MNRLKSMGAASVSLLLSGIASFYWTLILLSNHWRVHHHITHRHHDYVRTLYGRWARRGYAVFRLWGVRVRSNHAYVKVPENRPVIVVSSHHSSLDMVFLLGLLQDTFGRRNLRFVSRPGLDSGIPVISPYIKHYCYSLSRAGRFLAREQREDKIHMAEFCQRMNAEKGVVTIFPEGVKPRGQPEHSRTFIRSGLNLMLENMPDAIVLPLAIKGTGEFYSTPRRWKHVWKGFPRFGVQMEFSLLPPLEPRDYPSADAVIAHCEAQIHREYARMRHGKLPAMAAPQVAPPRTADKPAEMEEAC